MKACALGSEVQVGLALAFRGIAALVSLCSTGFRLNCREEEAGVCY